MRSGDGSAPGRRRSVLSMLCVLNRFMQTVQWPPLYCMPNFKRCGLVPPPLSLSALHPVDPNHPNLREVREC